MRGSRLSSLLPISDAAATLQALLSKLLRVFITPTTLSILVCWHRISSLRQLLYLFCSYPGDILLLADFPITYLCPPQGDLQ